MSSRSLFASLLVLLLLALAPAAWSMASEQLETVPTVYLPLLCDARCASRATPPENPEAVEARVIELVNEARVAAGCPAATPNDTLMRATGDWSSYMSSTGHYIHSAPDYYSRYGYESSPLENIGASGPFPELIFEAWMNSTPHRRAIEWCYLPNDPSYRPDQVYEIGVGYAGGYWTLAIGTR
jgi:uncharacterized protein YkwD